MQKDCEDGSSTFTITAQVFEDLPGTWVLNRSLQKPSGRCIGKATFTRRQPSPIIDDEGKLQLADAEMLYHEEGEFELTRSSSGQTPNSLTFRFSHKYIWRLQKAEDIHTLSVWFTKPGTDTIDYLFHKIDIALPNVHASAESREIALQGAGGHVCVDDFYSSFYVFNLSPKAPDSVSLVSWSMTHEVRGPKKDQTIETTFTKT
ncbi:hypothetical protein LTR10_015442 [Elasticomyces elasticus]|uniref:DUF6314 domain-containing protein n=1 Tax=Exophiala sideris TaxID=1016849 RepID=A0ABR0J483_9EURO|nr:hypothetical protein LTR10_015442 [Elasticomyces elasticus]KAK5026966.1 hypothetical protein LTS07_007265 [Exophiala sideris]KAK5033970.1 hypothetical protein LTR13_006570 [Exophiala sideris]KAK5055756.1 hypothetical protein LTR69_008131 [Exophiala sideris]KAK5180912.1 hypothetical protein LTR44_006732 [Eurotiomycetes sp. CCFEE 6388]